MRGLPMRTTHGAALPILREPRHAASIMAVDEINAYAGSLPIQLDTPFGPVAGSPEMFILPALGLLSTMTSVAFAAITGGEVPVYKDADSAPFSRTLEQTISAARANAADDSVSSNAASIFTQEQPTDDPASALRAAWERGDPATSLRPLVELAGTSDRARAEALALSRSTKGWGGLWQARIQHFEKVAFTGLKVKPYYALTGDGGIISHVHVKLGPLGAAWVSAAGTMEPKADEEGVVSLHFDDFWVGSDAPTPRDSPSDAEASAFDKFTRALGRSFFFEGLAGFPVDYADMKNGIVAFRFTAFDSCIVTKRAPAGEVAQWP